MLCGADMWNHEREVNVISLQGAWNHRLQWDIHTVNRNGNKTCTNGFLLVMTKTKDYCKQLLIPRNFVISSLLQKHSYWSWMDRGGYGLEGPADIAPPGGTICVSSLAGRYRKTLFLCLCFNQPSLPRQCSWFIFHVQGTRSVCPIWWSRRLKNVLIRRSARDYTPVRHPRTSPVRYTFHTHTMLLK